MNVWLCRLLAPTISHAHTMPTGHGVPNYGAVLCKTPACLQSKQINVGQWSNTVSRLPAFGIDLAPVAKPT